MRGKRVLLLLRRGLRGQSESIRQLCEANGNGCHAFAALLSQVLSSKTCWPRKHGMAPRVPGRHRLETTLFIVELLDPGHIRAMSRISRSTVHKTPYTS